MTSPLQCAVASVAGGLVHACGVTTAEAIGPARPAGATLVWGPVLDEADVAIMPSAVRR